MKDIHSRIREAGYFSESFRDESLAESFRRAKNFAGEHGRVASLPELIFYDRFGGPYTTNTQRYVLRDGVDTRLLIIHGDGPLSDPDRLEKAVYEPLYFGGGIQLTQEENDALVTGLNHKIPQAIIKGRTIPVYSYETIPEIASALTHYGIEIDFKLARSMKSGRQHHVELGQNHLFLADCGWLENALHYFGLHSTTEEEIDYSQTRQLIEDHFDPKVTRLSADKPPCESRTSIIDGEAILYEHPLAILNPFQPQGHFVHYGSSEFGFLSDIALTRGTDVTPDSYKGISSGYDNLRFARFLAICEQKDQWRTGNPEKLEFLYRLMRAHEGRQ